MSSEHDTIKREVLLAFWKVHILHHAGEGPVVGQWMLRELRSHGYEVSPGTLYPMLHRMEAYGWLKGTPTPGGGARARKEYRLTPQGKEVLAVLQGHVRELYCEVIEEADDHAAATQVSP
jgi:DNA-binding PadR family transcriptional regulator